MAAGPSHFCRHKSNQKGFQQRCFFAARGLYAANQTKSRAANYCPFLPLKALAWQNLLCPFQRSRPPLFCLISPEAYLLTLKNNLGNLLILKIVFRQFHLKLI